MSVKLTPDVVIAAIEKAAMRAIVRGTEGIKEVAIRSIQAGDKTGRDYRRRGVTHRASAPGEAPASDTGALVRDIRTEYDVTKLEGRVIFASAHAAPLEFGTERMEPRPFARPALYGSEEEIHADLSAEIAGALR